MITSKWSMPAALSESELQIYSVTHEYGHMLQNKLIAERMMSNGWDASNARAFVNLERKTRKAQYKWYYDIREAVQDECFRDIIDTAKNLNKSFSLLGSISKYGKSNKAEFFAEVFANSQLSKPNDLGKAMNVWLEKKGLIMK